MTDDSTLLIRELLEENHRYENNLPDKAVHKLTYLIWKRSKDRGVDVNVPFFWYRYGVMTRQPSYSSPGEPPTPGLDDPSKEALDDLTESALNDYYSGDLDEITDITYQDAPFDVYKHWRELDQHLYELEENYNPFFDNSALREDLETKIESVFDSFPIDEYPDHEEDLYDWYFYLTTELDNGLKSPTRISDINQAFWGIFSLSVAQDYHYNMSLEEVRQTLEIDSFEHEQAARRQEFNALKRESLYDREDSASERLNATTDAIVEPILDELSG